MGVITSTSTRSWSRLHFLIRLAGLTGLLVGAAGLVVGLAGEPGLGVGLGVAGGLAALVALVFEVRHLSAVVAARRGAVGSNVAAQVLLAALLVAEVNAFSFFHYHRFDCTRGREFTMPAGVKEQLSKLRGETTVVVHLSHNFGQLSDKRDEYDHAAERVVIDKVEDVAEQFREFGPQFRVVVLDVKDKNFRDKLEDLKKTSPELAAAVRAATEDSIFVLAQNKVQRLGFQEVFQLDKKASREADGGNGNLVLHYQGIEPFARRILNLDERKPRIGLGVIHEALSTEGPDEIGMAGFKKALTARGFRTRDILLKKWSPSAPPEPAVLTFDETKYEELEEQIADSDRAIQRLQAELKGLNKLLQRWRTAPPGALTKEFAEELGGRKVTEEIRELIIKNELEPRVTIKKLELAGEENDRRAAREQKKKLNVPGLAEMRRITDLRAKLARELADCDLLVLPRMTIFNAARGERIANRLYQLDPAQVGAIKDFLRQGKPVLALFGPTNEPGPVPQDFMHGQNDRLEDIFRELGIDFGKETVLYKVETKSYAERRPGLLILGVHVEVPQAEFAWEPGGRPGLHDLAAYQDRKANPLAESMRLTVAGLDRDQDLDLRIRDPRPVTYQPANGKRPAYDPTFLMTDPTAWKEKQPFGGEGKVPRPGQNETGQVSIGVAVEAALPPDWKGEKDKVRVAAVGHGGVFMGTQLSPVRQKLLLDTCNWLLGRDDLLARPTTPWEYPRVQMSDDANVLRQWGMRLGLPLLFVYLGVVVLMKRALR